MGNQCCSNKESDKYESQEANRKDIPGADVTTSEMVATAGSPPVAATKVGEPGAGTEFSVTIDKSDGTRLGVDVDHQDGVTLLIDAITGGLAKKWNSKNPDRQLMQGDRIVEVNGIRGDVQQLVEECKKNKVLDMKVLRAA